MQRWSKLFIPTLREAPADAEVASHKLLLRAGYIRQLGAGLYSYLPLGQRAVNKIIAIVREEMDTIAQEFLLPALNPKEVWEESGRWTGMGDNMFRLKDRKGAELCLGMTHEEIMTSIARNELRSYKQLPQIWYQIQNKFRDEPRPKSGLLRVRQFTMKDAYSFDIDEAGLDESYRKHDEVYRRIFTRCGLQFVAVDADSGAMGGSQSQEFMVYTDAGEDLIASCGACGYAANIEKATSKLAVVEDLTPANSHAAIPTPGLTTIDQLSDFLKIEPQHFIKTIALVATYEMANGRKEIPVAIFLRGDHSLNEAKLAGLFSGADIRPMQSEEIQEFFGSEPGYLGPSPSLLHNSLLKGKKGQFYFDRALLGRKNMVVGANQSGFHRYSEALDLPGDIGSFYDDFRLVNEGEPCPNCGAALKLGKAVEIGHIFKLGYKYSKSMGASVLDKDGKEVTPIMGSYGIGIERILTAAIEQSATSETDPRAIGNSMVLPSSIAPFQVVVTVTNMAEAALAEAGETIAAQLEQLGVDVLLDDRDERAGVKFKDADLVGIPYRINVGKKLGEGKVELVDRVAKTSADVALEDVASAVTSLLSAIDDVEENA
jgi:prolyl-tRNA synthetase